MFGLFKRKKNKKPKESLEFDSVPDGRYLVLFDTEHGGIVDNKETIICGFKIHEGPESGKRIAMVFTGKKVKNVLDEATGDFLNRLAGEEDKRAGRYEDWYYYHKHISDKKQKDLIVKAVVKNGLVNNFTKPPDY